MAEDKPHQALYRRYRPQTPAELLGQDHVVRALTGAIRENRLHHAFLFCGPRGTGKTSTARILAKMVNCEQAPTAEPCGVCEQCVAIREGTHVDVVEIDAASHGGVDDARDLREKAPTAAMVGREKIYIIDEAQRLSREAFDALLKLFEEPPPGVRFVLATTEPHKMPATIVGRCQRFDFRRHTMEGLASLLETVAASEGIELSADAARAIARQAEGSARDALSLLDQATVLGDDKVDNQTIRALLGAPRAEIQHELADVIAIGDARGAFEIVGRLVHDGQDIRNVTAESLAHFRNLMIAKTAPDQDDLIDLPADAFEALRIQAEKFAPAELARVISLLLAAQNDMRWTTSPRLSLELALVRACLPDTDPTPASILTRLDRLERLANLEPGTVLPAAGPEPRTEPEVDAARGGVDAGPSAGAGPVSVVEAPEDDKEPIDDAKQGVRAANRTRAGAEEPAQPEQLPARAADAASVDVTMLRRSWPTLIDHLGQMRPPQPILRALLESATPAVYDGQTLELAFPPAFRNNVRRAEDRVEKLQDALAELFGIRPAIAFVVREQKTADDPITVELIDEEPEPDEAEALKRVQEMLGAQPIEGGAE